ncbi:maleylacetate reductase and hydroxyquinol 1,2-dioxygenase domain-containing protein [Nonomuraea lactucae]|uniref:maleylacetate reductase and hydroxyquinol 1,2-dioxygenase domain-containing protein n=1 Tax=Nonomuraea lactucae TaxID=2249762 RepID=UPI000DE38E24|nr:maleylacetate reductase and hydroxyquinol 1,2-dioxygenase domain-containing protein [Nonomuraea lactucae]
MRGFQYTSRPARVVFGYGTADSTPAEAARLGAERIMLLTDGRPSPAADALAHSLDPLLVCRFDRATLHTPVDVTHDALAVALEHTADCLVTIGGGSTTGLSKALALRTGASQIVLPTTYAGSEVTPVLGETDGGRKVTHSDPAILPDTVIYDVALTLDLPLGITVTSAANALAHAVEALYSPQVNPVLEEMAVRAVANIARSLPALHADPADRVARGDLLEAAWLAGTCLGMAGMGLHHKLCHTLGGAFGLDHAAVHAALLPHVIEYNAPAAPHAMARIAQVLCTGDVAGAVHDLIRSAGGPVSLRLLGMAKDDLPTAAGLATREPYPNPREPSTDDVLRLLERAWNGVRPSSARLAGAGGRRAWLTEQVVAGMSTAPDTRLRHLLGDLVRRAHAFVADNQVTEAEWGGAIDFLTRAGQMTTDTRQEMILLSDVLGVSSMVDTVAHERVPDGTPSAVLGPFYLEGPPAAEHGTNIARGIEGVPLWVGVGVVGPDGEPVPGAVVDVWQSNADGFYDVQLPDLDGPVLRARFRTGDDGRLAYWSIMPSVYPIPEDGPVGELLKATGRHPFRAPHIHFLITAPGYRRLVTQLFVRDGAYVDSDAVFGVKPELVTDFPQASGPSPDGRVVEGAWHRLEFTFRLAVASEGKDSHG